MKGLPISFFSITTSSGGRFPFAVGEEMELVVADLTNLGDGVARVAT